MKRRGFLASVAAVVVVPFVSAVAAAASVATPGLALHPDAFAITMRPLMLHEQFGIDFAWESWSKGMAEAQAEGRRL